MHRMLALLAGLALLVGCGSLALTLYLWFGDWPAEMKAVVDYERSARQNLGKAPEPLLQSPRGQAHSSLNGTWQAVIDPYERGALGGVAPRAMEPGSPADLAEFSFENGLTLEVPGDWNTQARELVFYQGVVWYKRSFAAEPAPGTRSFLYFGAANYRAAVYLNGLLVGEHEGGFTPFNFDVTGQLRPGNLLVVKVDNRREASDIPTPFTDWHNYGGLTRDVLLVEVPDTHVSSYELRLDGEAGGGIVGWVDVRGPSLPAAVWLEIPELDVDLVGTTDADGRLELSLPVEPERWSPESPRLYAVSLGAQGQHIEDQIGFRSLAVVEGDKLLNVEPH